jgi:hypothetical protein
MKTKQNLIQTCLLAALLLVLPAVVQAQFNYTTTNGTITITGYTGSRGDVIIPNTINGLPVTSIGDWAFNGTSLASITIPDSVTSIGNSVFFYCTGLAHVTIGNSVTNIGGDAFFNCFSLGDVIIPNSVTTIGAWAFADCMSMGNIWIGNEVTNIGDGAFHDCFNLSGVYFEGNVPTDFGNLFSDDSDGKAHFNTTIYYLPEAAGWGNEFAGRPATLWLPQMQTDNTSFGVRTNQFGFNINCASGQMVVVEACTNLSNPIWFPVATNTLAGDSFYFSDPQSSNYPARFYRLRAP